VHAHLIVVHFNFGDLSIIKPEPSVEVTSRNSGACGKDEIGSRSCSPLIMVQRGVGGAVLS